MLTLSFYGTVTATSVQRDFWMGDPGYMTLGVCYMECFSESEFITNFYLFLEIHSLTITHITDQACRPGLA